jgi:hypothetical protein
MYRLSNALLFVALIGSALCVTGTQSPAAQKNNTRARGDAQVVEHLPMISIDAQVVAEGANSVVGGLTHNDFTILENDVQQVMYFWERRAEPLALVILVQRAPVGTKGTIFLGRQIEALRSSLHATLKEGDEVSVMVSGGQDARWQGYTRDPAKIDAALDSATQSSVPPDMTPERSLASALQEAAGHVPSASNADARRVILIVSNLRGRILDSLALLKEAMRAAVASQSIICVWSEGKVGHQPTPSDQHNDLVDRLNLFSVVRATGGEFVDNDWDAFWARLRVRYRMGYCPNTSGRTGELVRIRIALRPGLDADRRDLVLIYPRYAIIPADK